MNPTIGFLIDWISSPNHIELVFKLEEAAKNANVNLLTIMGGTLNSPKIYERKSNYLYDNPKEIPIEGLIIESGLLGRYSNDEQLSDFINQFNHIPVISMSKHFEGIHSVLIDNTQGFENLITHLISDHKCKNFAYVSGPKDNIDANQRLEAFRLTLKKNNVNFDEKALFFGDFINRSGVECIQYFIDEINLSFDCLVAANDDMAIGAISELKRRKISVPDTIKVTGFDDQINAKLCNPPLSTVRVPTADLALQAIDAIKKMIGGQEVNEIIQLPAKNVIRSSCGCDSANNGINEQSFDILPKDNDTILNLIDSYRNIGYTRDIKLLEKTIPYLLSKTNIRFCNIAFWKEFKLEQLISILNYDNNEAKISQSNDIFTSPYEILKKILKTDKTYNMRLSSIIFQDKIIGTIIYEVEKGVNLLESAMRTNLLDNLAKSLYIHKLLNHY